MKIPLQVNLPPGATLALVGSGEYLPPIEPVDRTLLARLNGSARVVCLPTAAGTESRERIQYWMDLGTTHFQRLGVTQVEAVRVVDRTSAEDAELAARIAAANFVYFSGGRPAHLYHTLADSKTWQAVQSVLEKGGVVAGCSAGAMIFGERIAGFPFPWPWQAGFNALPGTFIIPHFDELPSAIAKGLAHLPDHLKRVGIDGSTALVCTAEGCQVEGSGRVVVDSEVYRG